MTDTAPDGRSGGMFSRFFHSTVAGSVVLLACTVIALTWANSPLSESYFGWLHTEVGFSWGSSHRALPLHAWINDFLMAIFFFSVGLEIKRELVVGQLSSPRRAALPVMAALGGMLAPAAIYASLNAGGPGAQGWGVPMATDIAFALGILALFGNRVPFGLKIFVTALAIADDLGAVLVIALFYTEGIRIGALIAAATALLVLLLLARTRMRLPIIYAVLATVVWALVFSSGIHATVAGILVALAVPVKARIEPRDFIVRARDRLGQLDTQRLTRSSMLDDPNQLDAILDLNAVANRIRPVGITFERFLHPITSFVVLPLFALANAGVVIDGGVLTILLNPIGLGIVFGLFVGKQAGVFTFTWLAVRFAWAVLPEGVTWKQIYGAACVAGIGFTMSLFVSGLAFVDPALVDEAKIGILCGSIVSGVWGALVLHRVLPPKGIAQPAE